MHGSPAVIGGDHTQALHAALTTYTSTSYVCGRAWITTPRRARSPSRRRARSETERAPPDDDSPPPNDGQKLGNR